ncbi:MAG: hypothetical protein FWF09_08245, partial [Bacteroidales bacterium]|nr:hypothetical protein [Bacteroidales bacterium]
MQTDPHKRIEELESENRLLRAENKRLWDALGASVLVEPEEKPATIPITDCFITKYSTPEEKIGLFMSLFRGRMDVYAKRCYSKKHGSGYYVP